MWASEILIDNRSVNKWLRLKQINKFNLRTFYWWCRRLKRHRIVLWALTNWFIEWLWPSDINLECHTLVFLIPSCGSHDTLVNARRERFLDLLINRQLSTDKMLMIHKHQMNIIEAIKIRSRSREEKNSFNFIRWWACAQGCGVIWNVSSTRWWHNSLRRKTNNNKIWI